VGLPELAQAFVDSVAHMNRSRCFNSTVEHPGVVLARRRLALRSVNVV